MSQVYFYDNLRGLEQLSDANSGFVAYTKCPKSPTPKINFWMSKYK